MANFVCFLAARAAKSGWDVRKTGLGDSHPRMVMYASSETHTWIQKAADLFGFGTDAIRWIAVDEQQRMKTSELRQRIDADRASGASTISGRRKRGIGQHRRRRSAARDCRDLP